VLLGGVIGGKAQRGNWTMNARFNRRSLVGRIEAIAEMANRLRVTGVDAADLLGGLRNSSEKPFLFLDPPYYHKTDNRLYRNDYTPGDHQEIAGLLANLSFPWLATYDDCPEIRALYDSTQAMPYELSYTAGRKRRGSEVLFACSELRIPCVETAERVSRAELKELLDPWRDCGAPSSSRAS
jgi:DNA adenine methylase